MLKRESSPDSDQDLDPEAQDDLRLALLAAQRPAERAARRSELVGALLDQRTVIFLGMTAAAGFLTAASSTVSRKHALGY